MTTQAPPSRPPGTAADRARGHALALATLAAALLTLGCPADAQAQALAKRAGAPDYLALGIGSVPEFPGASDRQAVPAVLGRISLGGSTLRLQGNSFQLDLMPKDSAWAMGPMLIPRLGRDNDVSDPVIKTLRPIRRGVAAGAFAQYSWSGLFDAEDALSVGVEALGASTGAYGRASLGYQWAPVGDLRFNAGLGLGLASSKYLRTWFNIDADNAGRSGLPVYAGGSGLNTASVNLGASYALPSRWLLIGGVQLNRLVGDAADSPIVRQRGNRGQASYALALGRSF